MKLRFYESDDAAQVWSLHNVALETTGAHLGNGPWDEDLHFIPEVYINDGGCFVVGEIEGRIVAMGALKRTSDTKAEVKRMRVHPDFQRQGYGAAVLARLEKEARAMGISALHLDTAVVQEAAQKLYEKSGYMEVGRYAVAGLEAICYEKRLGNED